MKLHRHNPIRNVLNKLMGPCSVLRRLPRLLTHVDLVRGVAFSARLYQPANTVIARGALISHRVVIQNNGATVRIGADTQVNYNTIILGGSDIAIGQRVMIGPNCTIAAGDHDYKQTDKPMRFAGTLTKGPIVIEDDVWLGAGVVVTDGVTIGRGAVIGAGAVVTRDVPAFALAAGVPAKVIGYRDDQTMTPSTQAA